MNKFISLFVIIAAFFFTDLNAQQLAFPGAEGFGRYTTGGRGGRVIEVTNLNDYGAGSLRDALSKSYPRVIVFKVSGTIFLDSPIKISHGYVTVAGQTAPGDGICIANYTLSVQANNVIIRYIRCRMGDLRKYQDDAIHGNGGYHNIIIDHCSFSWSIDEAASFYDNKDFTLQWCIISESLYHSFHEKGDHGYGGIWGGMGATFHHNLLADHSSRLPRFCGARYHLSTANTEIVDFRNNLIFNWGFNSAYGGESGNQNIINNYYKPGPATKSGDVHHRIINPSDAYDPPEGYSKWYVAGNFMEGDTAVTNNNWNGGVQPSLALLDSFKLYEPIEVAPVITETAQNAYYSVLENAGANYPTRDSADLRVINEVKTGNAPFGATYAGGMKGIIDSQTDVGGWPTLNSTTPPIDSDHDGMPDEYENSNALNPSDSSDASIIASNGYSNIENYVNSLVGSPATSVEHSKIETPTGFKLYNNYPNPFNPATIIIYDLPVSSKVNLSVYNALGKKVSTLVNRLQPAGSYKVSFSSSVLPSGVYFARISAGGFSHTIKLILLK